MNKILGAPACRSLCSLLSSAGGGGTMQQPPIEGSIVHKVLIFSVVQSNIQMVSLMCTYFPKALNRACTYQNMAHWGNPSAALLSVCTQPGSGALIHLTDLLLLKKIHCQKTFLLLYTKRKLKKTIYTGYCEVFFTTLDFLWHRNQWINLCSTLTLTCMKSPSSTTHNFPAFKCYVKHIKLLHSFSTEIKWIMIQQTLFWRGRTGECEECLDTKARRKACSSKWVGFHTYKQSQYPKLKVWRCPVSWCHPQVLLGLQKGRNLTKGQVWMQGGANRAWGHPLCPLCVLSVRKI